MSIGVAILGAGIFAKTEHLPAVTACSDLELKAVYSRSKSSATGLASEVSGSKVDTYFDEPADSARSLQALLARDDIQAVIVALPILNGPAFIKQAVEAGKHVLSEKPIDKDLQAAQDLIRWYDALPQDKRPLWGVAENFRYTPTFLKGAELLKNLGGKVVTFSVRAFIRMDETNKYFHTTWRQAPNFQGGYVLDGGVHYTAGLRMLLGAVGEEVESLQAFTYLVNPKLAPVDALSAVMRTRNGVPGTFTATWSSPIKRGTEIEIVTTNGTVVATGVDAYVKRKEGSGEPAEEHFNLGYSSGVKAEVESFARGILNGRLDPREEPGEAVKDLAMVEAILTSGEQKGALQTL